MENFTREVLYTINHPNPNSRYEELIYQDRFILRDKNKFLPICLEGDLFYSFKITGNNTLKSEVLSFFERFSRQVEYYNKQNRNNRYIEGNYSFYKIEFMSRADHYIITPYIMLCYKPTDNILLHNYFNNDDFAFFVNSDIFTEKTPFKKLKIIFDKTVVPLCTKYNIPITIGDTNCFETNFLSSVSCKNIPEPQILEEVLRELQEF
ncbi:MAG TPA: hypothetical protein P5513_01700 [Candidatus Diapherotrites archaeon]|nr:hypothetical protein [Candidatus Diapherotrites archaeon]